MIEKEIWSKFRLVNEICDGKFRLVNKYIDYV